MAAPNAPGDTPIEPEVCRDLLQLMVHDLRNPLAALSANASYLDMLLTSFETREALGDLRTSLQVLQHLIENVALIAALRTPRANEAPTRRSLREAVDDAVRRQHEALAQAGVALRLELAPAPLWVIAPRGALEGLLDNLLWNVAQHVRRGGVAVLSAATGPDAASSPERPASVRLRLDDDGPPFGPAALAFSAAGQLALKQQSEGRYARGLGLYVLGLAAKALDASVDTHPELPSGALTLSIPSAAES